MQWLELKIPPPLVALACAALLWAAGMLWPAGWGRAEPGLRLTAVLALAATGLALDLVAVWRFIRARTTVHPLRPETSAALVTGGLYRFTRNPMYLGMALLLGAFALWHGHPAGIAALALFTGFITRFQIIPEERVLAAKFGEEFAAYQAQVRRWI